MLYAGLERDTEDAEFIFSLLFILMAFDLPAIRITSWKERRGDPASQHNGGTAIDVGMKTPEEAASARALAQRWQELGLTAVEEGYFSGSVPHVHIQLFPKGVGYGYASRSYGTGKAVGGSLEEEVGEGVVSANTGAPVAARGIEALFDWIF